MQIAINPWTVLERKGGPLFFSCSQLYCGIFGIALVLATNGREIRAVQTSNQSILWSAHLGKAAKDQEKQWEGHSSLPPPQGELPENQGLLSKEEEVSKGQRPRKEERNRSSRWAGSTS